MQKQNPVRILMTAATAFELYLLTAIVILLKKINPFVECDLILNTKILDTFNPAPEILDVYKKIYKADLAGLSPSSRKLPLNIKRGLKLRHHFKKLPKNYDIVCINSYNEFFANVLYRHLPKNTHVIVVTPYANFSSTCDNIPSLPKPLLNATFRLCDVLFGFSPTRHRWSQINRRSIERKILKLPSHKTVVFADHEPEHALPENVFFLPPPFMALKELFIAENAEQPAICVIGERTPPYPTWCDEDQAQLKAFFDYLRHEFPTHQLYYRPRAGMTKLADMKPLLEKFHIMDEPIPFEELLAKRRFDKIISIKSTTSKVAVFYGIPGYLIYPLFDMPQDFREAVVESIFTDSEKIIRVHELDDLKKEPQHMPSASDLTTPYAEIFLR